MAFISQINVANYALTSQCCAVFFPLYVNISQVNIDIIQLTSMLFSRGVRATYYGKVNNLWGRPRRSGTIVDL